VSSRFRLPSLFSSSASDEQVVSFAKHVINDHLVLVYALSRDRKLRVWHGLTGALLKTTDVRSSSREIALRNSQDSSSSPSSLPLPENSSVSLVRVVPHPSSSSKVSHLVVVFLSTPKSSVSPGSFIVYRVGRSYSGAGDVSFAGERQCPGRVAGAELRGFEVLPPIQKEGLDSGWRLWTIWDKQGSTACESVLMDDLFQFTTYIEPVGGALLLDWQPATVDDTVQTFDSAYFDNLVPLDPPEPTRPGDNADIGRVFAEHLLYPGRFSILSLTSALDEYVADLPEQVRNTAISRSYVSLREKFETIVGCDLVMRQDDLTGAAKVQEYRSELKIAWLAVWTRVRYLDTSSRWPMGTALVEDQLVAVTREGCSVPVPFDTCGLVNALGSVDHVADGIQELPEGSFKRLHAALASPVARSDLIAVSNAGSHISSVLGSVAHDEYNETALEAFIEKLDTLVAKPYLVDIEESTTQFWSVNVEPYIPEHDNIAVRRFLSECPDISRGLTETLDVLATVDNTDAAVDVGLRFSGFGNALLAADLASTIRGRYQLARSAVLIAIFNMVDLGGLDGETDETEEYVRLLYRAFTTYGRYRVLHWTAEQAVDENRTVSTVGTNKRKHEAELADGFNTLRVAVGDETDAEDHDSAYSLLHSLLARGLATETRSHGLGQLYAGAQSFLRSILSLTPNTWDNKPLAKDVRFAFDVLQDDQPRHAGMITSFFPHSAGMLYVRGRACVELEEVEEAVVYFEKAAAAHDGVYMRVMLLARAHVRSIITGHPAVHRSRVHIVRILPPCRSFVRAQAVLQLSVSLR
jgi:nuclear pore complex protein Nup160